MTTNTETVDLLSVAAELVTRTRHGSPSMLMRRIHQDHGINITFDAASCILIHLYRAGIVGPRDTSTHACPVLMEREEAAKALKECRKASPADWGKLYECPSCCRVAAWTDGRRTVAGDPEDEFWCQTCGAEAPLTACRKI
ncbi:hypothetical protein [Streptomyces violascens]|uniref:hypothetical protein n=1 Tax=Streptomyces violascens TaxID=67381 RepID=UPI0036CBC1F5